MPVSVYRLCPAAETLALDADLLGRFAASRDEAAFAELVRRHGPLVYRVCRRLAPAVADDAFQAVFIVLARRAGAVRSPAAVASWLVGTAGRVARQMRQADLRRAAHERRAGRPEAVVADAGGDLAAVLGDELARLPAALRDPVLLCLVGGRTHAEAAAALGGSVRTLRRRLDRARAVLRARLAARGVAPAAAAALATCSGGATASVPRGLSGKTVVAALAPVGVGGSSRVTLVAAQGVIQDMTRTKISVVVTAAAALVATLGVCWSEERPAPAPATPLAAPVVQRPEPGGPDQRVVRTANFEVHAPTPVLARAFAAEAEFQRRAVAVRWLGAELPRWEKPCVVDVAQGNRSQASTLTFADGPDGRPRVNALRMEIRGDVVPALTNALPHEVTHLVLGTAAGQPVPRWADEGLAVLAESAEEQAVFDTRIREILERGRAFQVKALLAMSEYPRDAVALYAQAYSVARFLATRGGKLPAVKDVVYRGGTLTVDTPERRLAAFVLLGSRGGFARGWEAAAKDVYGFDSLDALERAWLDWLFDPKNSIPPEPAGKTSGPKDGADDRIPLRKVPRVTAPVPR
jgi:RNA polymerase sigma factor (sigma-70 family)